jgi:hypothetical protein
MNGDQELAPIVEAWLKQTADSPYAPRVGVGRVMTRVRQTGRRGRLASFLRIGHVSVTPLGVEVPQHRTGPTPARADDPIPVTRRTATMFTLARSITTAAIVFTLGGAMLIGRPLEYLGFGVPEASSEAATQPTWVTGKIALAASCSQPTRETVDGVVHERGYRCAPQKWALDDPRVSGDVTLLWDADVHDVGAFSVSVSADTWVIHGEGGDWTCHSRQVGQGYGLWAGSDLVHLACAGEGGHEGLLAALEIDWSASGGPTVQGLIHAGELLEHPEPAADD